MSEKLYMTGEVAKYSVLSTLLQRSGLTPGKIKYIKTPGGKYGYLKAR